MLMSFRLQINDHKFLKKTFLNILNTELFKLTMKFGYAKPPVLVFNNGITRKNLFYPHICSNIRYMF